MVALRAAATVWGASLVLAPAAWAGKVSLSGGELSYVGLAGEVNHVLVSPGPHGSALLREGGGAALVAGAGCRATSATVAACDVGPVTSVSVDAGDGDDEVIVRLPVLARLDGGSGDDLLYGSAAGDELAGGEGDDVLRGYGGDDTLHGGPGDESLDPGAGNDLADGGDGRDRVLYASRTAPVAVILDGLPNDGDPVAGERDDVRAEWVVGGAGGDVLVGGDGANILDGRGGDDVLVGNGGADVLRGQDGNDTIDARDGAPDRVDCGAGDDWLRPRGDRTSAGCETVTPDETLDTLWDATVTRLLASDLWTARDAYDATAALLVPLTAAFREDRADWQAQFTAFFARYVAASGRGEVSIPSDVQRFQWHLLSTRFIALAHAAGRDALVPPGLAQIVFDDVGTLWQNGLRRNVLRKLSSPAGTLSRALGDVQLYPFALASDLLSAGAHVEADPRSPVLSDIVSVGLQAFRSEPAWQDDGGWVFQPGAWSDHPDYAYAGRTEKSPDLQQLRVPGIAPDTSHSARLPVYLDSLAATRAAPDDVQLLDDLRAGLRTQLALHVIVPASPDFPAPRLTNFMDGRNGIFRWGYPTQGPAAGYGPYELSGAFSLGWWSLAGGRASQQAYRDLAVAFPLPAHVLGTYLGPNTTRARNPLMAEPAAFANGLRELDARLAAALA